MAGKDNLRPPWKPGESGNPKGRPPHRKVLDALLPLLEEKDGQRLLAKVLLTKALQGDHHFMRMILDRIDGPVKGTGQAEDGDSDALREFLGLDEAGEGQEGG